MKYACTNHIHNLMLMHSKGSVSAEVESEWVCEVHVDVDVCCVSRVGLQGAGSNNYRHTTAGQVGSVTDTTHYSR